ncbi:hypothetical protein KMW40_24695 [Enterobacter cloacae]|uniref:fimbrial protein n=1 Tax=Enterobacter cloacae TaxID=550 RepID=UPI0034A3EC22
MLQIYSLFKGGIWSIAIALTFYAVTSLAEETGDTAISGAVFARGSVSMHGTILDATCSIMVGDAKQQVYLGPSPLKDLEQKSESRVLPLTVYLTACTQGEHHMHHAHSHFNVSFTANEEEQQSALLFPLTGETQGAGLAIENKKGEYLMPNVSLPENEAHDDHENMSLDYFVRLMKTKDELLQGNYRATVRLALNYD